MLMSHPSPVHLDAETRGVAPRLQRGAYAVIRDDWDRVLVVEAGNGRCYLPGGRIEPGESAATALVREISEECGWFAIVDGAITQAVQTIFEGDVQLEATYWYARMVEKLDVEPEHRLRWLAIEDASEALHRAGDRLALEMAR